MIIKKTTQGWVDQYFDSETGKAISQEFIAGDEVSYYDAVTAERTDPTDHYLPFSMVQPTGKGIGPIDPLF